MLTAFSFEVPGYQAVPGFQVIRAASEELADFVFRFRYHVYVETMKRRQVYADHARGLLKEPLDERGDNYLAIKDGAVIGTIRRNLVTDPAAGYYQKLYRSGEFGDFPEGRVALTTKLMVLPQFQSTPHPIKLIIAYAEQGYRNGVGLELLDCNRHLVSFFEKMGYFSYRGWAFHREFGTVRPMFFAADTVAYLEKIGSFLRTPAAKALPDGHYGGYALIRRFAEEPWTERIREASKALRAVA